LDEITIFLEHDFEKESNESTFCYPIMFGPALHDLEKFEKRKEWQDGNKGVMPMGRSMVQMAQCRGLLLKVEFRTRLFCAN
jgi:hypothetical protein